jgi:hypothetical protein
MGTIPLGHASIDISSPTLHVGELIADRPVYLPVRTWGDRKMFRVERMYERIVWSTGRQEWSWMMTVIGPVQTLKGQDHKVQTYSRTYRTLSDIPEQLVPHLVGQQVLVSRLYDWMGVRPV